MARRGAGPGPAALLDEKTLSVLVSFLPLRDLLILACVAKRFRRDVWKQVRRLTFRSISTNIALRAPQLVSLRLMGCSLPATVLETACVRMTALRMLDVAEVSTFSVQTLRAVGHATGRRLTWLDVSKSAAVTDELLKELGAFTALRYLALDSGVTWDDAKPYPAPLALRPLAALARLTELHLSRVPLTDQAFGAAARSWARLERLYLYRAHKLGDATLATLERSCPALRKLKVWDALDMHDEAVERLVRSLTALTVLALYDTGVTHAMITSLRNTWPRLTLKGEGRKK